MFVPDDNLFTNHISSRQASPHPHSSQSLSNVNDGKCPIKQPSVRKREYASILAKETDSAQCVKHNTFWKHSSSKSLTLTPLDDRGNLIDKKTAPVNSTREQKANG